jgi:hypothetical protein
MKILLNLKFSGNIVWDHWMIYFWIVQLCNHWESSILHCGTGTLNLLRILIGDRIWSEFRQMRINEQLNCLIITKGRRSVVCGWLVGWDHSSPFESDCNCNECQSNDHQNCDSRSQMDLRNSINFWDFDSFWFFFDLRSISNDGWRKQQKRSVRSEFPVKFRQITVALAVMILMPSIYQRQALFVRFWEPPGIRGDHQFSRVRTWLSSRWFLGSWQILLISVEALSLRSKSRIRCLVCEEDCWKNRVKRVLSQCESFRWFFLSTGKPGHNKHEMHLNELRPCF